MYTPVYTRALAEHPERSLRTVIENRLLTLGAGVAIGWCGTAGRPALALDIARIMVGGKLRELGEDGQWYDEAIPRRELWRIVRPRRGLDHWSLAVAACGCRRSRFTGRNVWLCREHCGLRLVAPYADEREDGTAWSASRFVT